VWKGGILRDSLSQPLSTQSISLPTGSHISHTHSNVQLRYLLSLTIPLSTDTHCKHSLLSLTIAPFPPLPALCHNPPSPHILLPYLLSLTITLSTHTHPNRTYSLAIRPVSHTPYPYLLTFHTDANSAGSLSHNPHFHTHANPTCSV